jgi:tetratricopeptide (TPR) repeat protein
MQLSIPASRPPFVSLAGIRSGLVSLLLSCLVLAGCQEDVPANLLAQVTAQHQAGAYEETLEPLRKYLAENPDDSEASFLYGRALVFTGQGSLASWSLRKAMEDPKWRTEAGTQLAFAALATRDFNEVIEITGRILEQDPENVWVQLLRAQAYAHWRMDPELALAAADRVFELDPDKLEAYEPRILALLTLERMDEAREQLAEAGRRLAEIGATGEVLAWHCSTTATFEQEEGETEKARETWARCLETYPTSMEVVVSAMSFYDARGESERSLELLRGALERNPASREMRVALAERLRVAGELAEAEALLREPTGSDDPLVAASAWMDLASYRFALEEEEAAADALGSALEVARQTGTPDPELVFQYADAQVLAGRFARALEAAEEITIPAHRLLILGRVAQEQRAPAQALEHFDEALRLWPDNPWARYFAALAAEELGDFERALEEYRYSVRISPGATDARVRGAALLYAEGRALQAREMLLTAAAQSPLEIEGHVLRMRLSGFLGDMASVREVLDQITTSNPGWAGRALLAAAEGVERRSGPVAAMGMLAEAPVDYQRPRNAPALRALVRYSHEADAAPAERVARVQEWIREILASRPDFGPFQEIRALDLELSGEPREAVRGAYERALTLVPGDAQALAGLGRQLATEDAAAAVALFDQAAAADPLDPSLPLAAAKTLLAAGEVDEAARRLDALLLEHPLEVAAAVERARLDLQKGVATQSTLERAIRAARLGGGPDALDLLSEVYAKRDEPVLAGRAAEQAQAMRDAMRARSAPVAPAAEG